MRKIIIATLSVSLLCLCLAIVGIFAFSAINVVSNDNFGINLGQPTFTAEADDEQRLSISGSVELNVNNDFGNVTITAADIDEVVISMHKIGRGTNKEKAQEALANLKVDITQNKNIIHVVFEQPKGLYSNVSSVDFTIKIPYNTQIIVDTGSGNILLRGIHGNANLKSNFGDIKASQINGSLLADTHSGKVDAQNIEAGKADIALHSDFGDISLEEAGGQNISLTSNSGELKIKNVQASEETKLESGFGAIHATNSDAEALTINTNSGKIELSNLAIRDSLIAHSKFGDIDLEQVAADSYDLDTNSGAISVEGIHGKTKIHSGFGNINITQGEQVTLDLNTNSGTVRFSGTLGNGPHITKSEFGSITITIPPETALSVDLKTNFGKIHSDLPITMTQENDMKDDHWIGTLNDGDGANLTAETNSGDIRIEILNP